MKNKILGLMMACVLAVGLVPGTAFAWTYGLSGSGVCQPNGSYLISWVVDNTTEPEELKITSSSNTSVVDVGETIPAKQKETFTQTVPGTASGTFTLTLKGNWHSDSQERTREGTVTLTEACTQPTPPPVTPPEGGRGGEEPTVTKPVVIAAATTNTPTLSPAKTPQVQAPVGGVGAGTGAGNSGNGSLIGLASSLSLAALGLGLRRLSKNS